MHYKYEYVFNYERETYQIIHHKNMTVMHIFFFSNISKIAQVLGILTHTVDVFDIVRAYGGLYLFAIS